jgi:hypothetical protein
MTPAQLAAELETIVAAINTTLDSETADRQYALEATETRLAGLAARLLAATGDTPAAALAPGQLADRLTAGLNGPYTDDDTTGAAGLAAEAVRFLNYATGLHAGQGLTKPAAVYSVTGNLAVAAERMPQLFGQLTRWLDAEHAAARLGDDHGGPVGPLADRARFHLDHAAWHASALSEELAATQVALATVHGKRTEATS